MHWDHTYQIMLLIHCGRVQSFCKLLHPQLDLFNLVSPHHHEFLDINHFFLYADLYFIFQVNIYRGSSTQKIRSEATSTYQVIISLQYMSFSVPIYALFEDFICFLQA